VALVESRLMPVFGAPLVDEMTCANAAETASSFNPQTRLIRFVFELFDDLHVVEA